MRKDVKIGMLAGAGLAVLAAVLFSFFTDSVAVERQKRFALELRDEPRPEIPDNAVQRRNAVSQPNPPAADINRDGESPRVHIVRAGQTLMSISMQYYGTTDGWKRILDANAGIISNANQIREGMRLLIPPYSSNNTRPQG